MKKYILLIVAVLLVVTVVVANTWNTPQYWKNGGAILGTLQANHTVADTGVFASSHLTKGIFVQGATTSDMVIVSPINDSACVSSMLSVQVHADSFTVIRHDTSLHALRFAYLRIVHY